MSQEEDPLAYGRYYGDSERGEPQDGSRGIIGDTFKKLKETYRTHHEDPSYYSGAGESGYESQPAYHSPNYGSQQQQYSQPQYGQPSESEYRPPPYQSKPHKPGKTFGFLDKIQDAIVDLGSEAAQRLGTAIDPQGYGQYGANVPNERNRFGSFAPEREGNDVKWYVDGCNYFWAVSRALETARESIWILDWWLSPELFLRRPPAKNQQYRLDRMLQAAAQRGVRINVIVYKEVAQALTLSSEHTKHSLEALHPNIAVFRHPDHLPDTHELTSSLVSSFQHLNIDSKLLGTMSGDSLRGLYGITDDIVLFWAHHEKLCLIDGRIAFMGGLDLCFGRWDTHQHAIADVHPTDLEEIVFPGQDYNNARVLDFQDVSHWEKNQLNRTATSRMGWSDISVSLHGPVVEDLRRHFVERWNFIFDTKYKVRDDRRYTKLALYGQPNSTPGQYQQTYQTGSSQQPQQQSFSSYQEQSPSYNHPQSGTHHAPGSPAGGQVSSPYQQGPPISSSYGQSPGNQQYPYTDQSFPPPPPGPPPIQSSQPYYPPPPSNPSAQAPYFPPPPNQQSYYGRTRDTDEHEERAYDEEDRGRGSDQKPRRFRDDIADYGNVIRGQLAGQIHEYQDRIVSSSRARSTGRGNMSCQILRSCSKWSHGVPTEHSIANAYAEVIRHSEHFVYIENQFFITATGDLQEPITNKIGAAIVERILRAARAGQKYKVIVVIPSVPAFAGDLRDDSALGTRAIMNFQYRSINRGGHSIMELIAKEGFNPMEYIRFCNLRNYDRINANAPMYAAEQSSGVSYEYARKQQDVNTAGPGGYGPGAPPVGYDTTAPYQQYQHAATQLQGSKSSTSGRWDSVSECYMLNGPDIRSVPWEGAPEAEMDAFVSEELYVHTKVMIADDRVVICGSANLNDRSQLGDHDSEIAILIEDTTPVHSTMNGKPWIASRFAASLRRELFRKHLGLLSAQDYKRADANSEPVGVPNLADFDSSESQIVADPLADTFHSLWNSRARTNTEIFRRIFHAVPDDNIRNWTAYKEFYGYFFHKPDGAADGKSARPARYEWGHVVRENFPPGPEGVRQVKELLSQVKGTLVEMPLMFLIEENIAQEGLSLNDLTETLYT